MVFMGNLNLTTKRYNPGHTSAIHSTESNKGSKSKSPIKHDPLKIYHQNICGLRYKIDKLLSLLYPDFPHIICITEHHLNYTELSSIIIDNYKLCASYCRRAASKGGTCIYVTVKVKTNCSDFDIELCSIKIQSDSSYVYIFAVYRAPSGTFTCFMQKMYKILKSLYNSKIEFIIC